MLLSRTLAAAALTLTIAAAAVAQPAATPSTGVVQAGSPSDGNFSVTCTLTEKRQVDGGMLVSTRTKPQRVKVDYLDGGFTFKFNGVMYTSPRLDARGVAETPDGEQYIYSRDDRAFSVAKGEQYLELARCK